MKKQLVKMLAAAGVMTLLTASLSACTGANVSDIMNQLQTSEPVSGSETASASETSSESGWEKPSAATGTEGGEEGSNPTGDVATEEDYLAFIDGNEKICVEYEFAEALKAGESYTLDELVKHLNEELPENWGPEGMDVDEVSYAIIDCGNDGNPEMLLCVEASVDQEYGLTEYYVVKKKDGKLNVIANHSTQGRSQGDFNKYGVYHSFGSGGAALWYDGYERIKADGSREFIYDCETNMGLAAPVLYGNQLPSTAKLPDGLTDYPEEIGEYSVKEYSFKEYTDDMYDDETKYDAYKTGKIYVFYDPKGEQCFPKDEDEKFYFDLGITVTDEDNLHEFLAERYHELGITEDEMKFEGAEPQWKVVRDYRHTEGQGGEN